MLPWCRKIGHCSSRVTRLIIQRHTGLPNTFRGYDFVAELQFIIIPIISSGETSVFYLSSQLHLNDGGFRVVSLFISLSK